MIWFRNAWSRFFVWVASWFAPKTEALPKFDKHAQELIALAAAVREKWRQETVGTSVISRDAYREMMRAQMEEPAVESPRVYRSATFRTCMNEMEREAKVKREAKKLTLKVQE